jgi:hypothetical protein
MPFVDLTSLESMIPSEEELRQLAAEHAARLSATDREDYLRGWPKCPAEPGLYALVAPDEVTVRVVCAGLSDRGVRTIVVRDIVGRMLRSLQLEMAQAGSTFAQIIETIDPRINSLKSLYRMERLPES